MTQSHRTAGARPLLVAAVLVNAAVLVVGSTVAAFTGRAGIQQTGTAAGSVSITLSSTGTRSLSTGVTGLGAGDWFERLVTVSPGAGLPIGSWTLSTSAVPVPADAAALAPHLRLKVERCEGTWTDASTAETAHYTCTSGKQEVLPDQSLLMTDKSLTGLGQGSHTLLLTVMLAESAPDALQSVASTLTYTFGGVQAPGTRR